MKSLATFGILLGLMTPFSDATPSIVWSRCYFGAGDEITSFNDVHQTSDGGFVVAGSLWLYNSPEDGAQCLFRMDSDGELLWTYGHEGWYIHGTGWVEELSDSDIVAVGTGRISASTHFFLFLVRLDAEGGELWTKGYSMINGDTRGYCITPLPDGGFLLCGSRAPDQGNRTAWILRTDSSGNTIWTREWGGSSSDNMAVRALFENDGVVVLIQGEPPAGDPGPHLVRYELNGDLSWQALVQDLEGLDASDFCSASDGGYVVLSHGPDPVMVHVDSLGQSQWITEPVGVDRIFGNSINPTMDGGYIYAGENRPIDSDLCGTGLSGYSSEINKFDSGGGLQWFHKYTLSSSYDSARQLAQGGYIAAGVSHSLLEPRSTGRLVRYDAETGLEEESGAPEALGLVLSPNPFSCELLITWTLPDHEPVSVSVFDLSGRRVATLVSEPSTGRRSSVTWIPDPVIDSGFYLIVLEAGEARIVQEAVLLR